MDLPTDSLVVTGDLATASVPVLEVTGSCCSNRPADALGQDVL